MARKLTAVAFSLGCLHASSTFALGLGEIKLESFLNEPLEARVDLLNTGGLHGDEIHIRLASREDFDRLGVERAYFLTSMQFEVNVDASGRGTITIKSEEPVLEPYLDFIVEARWPSGRLLREYTVLLDPPLFDSSSPQISASQRVEEVEGIPAPETEAKKPEGAAATSGTRVDVRQSDLGPGEMPQRDFNAETAATPTAGSRYMISKDDTLWEIAATAKPGSASVHQTMLDIQRLNPDAFINGNINQIKAGYIVYLPDEGDISSQDLQTALAEVKQQNEDWRAGRASTPSSGPSLRISAGVEPEPGETAAAAVAGSGGSIETNDTDSSGESYGSGTAEVEELQRLLSLKDEQIAELQAALAAAREEAAEEDLGSGEEPYAGTYDELDTGAELDAEAAAEPYDEGLEDGAEEGDTLTAMPAPETDTAPEPEVKAAPPKPEPKPKPAPRPAPKPQDSGWMSYALYGLGALVLAVLVFLFMRRRGADEDEQELSPRKGASDAFKEVKLKSEPEPEPEPEPLFDAEEQEPVPEAPAQAYGQRKNDEYAADMDSSDALAEADIYIAYGRYNQARELLRNALDSEPDNNAYRLKLVEAEVHLGNRPAAREQLYELEARGDSAGAARARELLGESDSQSQPPAGLAEEVSGNLESEFAGLEIESGGLGDDDLDDDLDLSADFDESPLGDDDEDDEDLVIAADANGMSTKLDLARAYLDMGDEDGARQILEEVIAEGSDEYRAEAEALLQRID